MRFLLNHLLLLLILLLSLTACKEKLSLEELSSFSATETYPDDEFLGQVQNKRALIIVAHDDDDCAMSGTISKLTAKDWVIQQLCLQNHINPETGQNGSPVICAGSRLILSDRFYRLGLDTMSYPYLPIPYAEIEKQFLTEKVRDTLIRLVNTFDPSVIFTLDDVKGGYGHPEHVFISRLVKNLFDEKKLKCARIYQSVYTNHMESEIVDKWLGAKLEAWGFPNASKLANTMYGIDGMPEPDVQVNITDQAETKMRYLKAYDNDTQKNLRKFIPDYDAYDAKTYFGIFNREFFRVIH